MKVTQYTIRGVPQPVDAQLRSRARKEGKSLNRLMLELIQLGLGTGDTIAEYHDMDDLIGTWKEDPQFDSALESMNRIDEDLWR